MPLLPHLGFRTRLAMEITYRKGIHFGSFRQALEDLSSVKMASTRLLLPPPFDVGAYS